MATALHPPPLSVIPTIMVQFTVRVKNIFVTSMSDVLFEIDGMTKPFGRNSPGRSELVFQRTKRRLWLTQLVTRPPIPIFGFKWVANSLRRASDKNIKISPSTWARR